MPYIGSICHNDDDPRDPGHRRVRLYLDDGRILADDGEARHDPDVDRPRDLDHAQLIVSRAWSGPEWDPRLDDDGEPIA